MMKQTIVLCSMVSSFTVMGQTVVSTQGETYETSTGSISFTVGEVVINTGSDGSTDLTQGFHQTNWNFVGLEDYDANFEALVYPNPTSDLLNIEVSNFDNVRFELYDATGRIVSSGALSDVITQVQVGHFEPGSYHLQLLNDANDPLKNFKLIKQH